MNWKEYIGKRLLLTDSITGIARDEWILLELAPSLKRGKFRNETASSRPEFWHDLDELRLLEVLPLLTHTQP